MTILGTRVLTSQMTSRTASGFLTNSDGSVASYLSSIACSMSAMAKCDLLRIKDENLRNAEEEASTRRARCTGLDL